MGQKVIKTGNSAAVTIPSEFMNSLSVKIGDDAVAKMNFEEGSITYVFPQIRQLRFSDSRRSAKHFGKKKK